MFFDVVVTGSFIFVAQLGAFLRWLYRRMRSDEINRTFVEDVATNHLPHFQHRTERMTEGLNRLLEKNGLAPVPFDEPPPIRWIKLAP
ncbi:MAG: hypothetical protein ACYDCD_00685 [Candidatus Acidiferrales bacterium]